MPDLLESNSSQPYEQWHFKVWEAYSQYLEATSRCREILEEHLQCPIGSPDDASALTRAHRVEFAASQEYMRVLRIFTELVTQRKVPPEEQSQD